MTDGTITKSINIAAPREKVWDFLTKAHHLEKWFHKPKSDIISDQSFEMVGRDGGTICSGVVDTMARYESLKYNFTAAPMKGHQTKVHWTLKDVPGGTHLTMVHSGFPTGHAGFGLLSDFDKGWDGHLIKMREIKH